MNKILLCFGTRPEWLKIKPLIKELRDYKLLFTGQHEDLLKDVKVDFRIKINESNNRLDQLISDCLLQFPEGDFDSVLVQGDTASAFACALAAFNRGKKIYYLEAGLRSYNLQHPYPEEGYRQMIARISDINFCPTKLSEKNLLKEKTNGSTHVVGNTVLDNLLKYKKDCEYKDKVLITLHRRENHKLLKKWFRELDELAEYYDKVEFILPLHPNPNVQKHKNIFKHINKVMVCRETTERPEGIDTSHLYMCKSPDYIFRIFDHLYYNHEVNNECPYGDGKSSIKIAKIINEISGNRR